jgi:alpha-galactosidase
VAKSKGIPQTPRLLAGAPVVTAIDGAAVTPTSNALVSAGAKLTTSVTVRNDGTTPVAAPKTTLTVPSGWTVSAQGRPPVLVLPGRTARFDFAVTVPATAAAGSLAVTAAVRFLGLRGTETVQSPPLQVTIAPAPPSGVDQPLSHQPWITGTSGWMQPAIDESVGGGNPIAVAGTVHPTGIGVASPSDIRYYIGGACTKLSGVVGIDDVVGNVGPEGGTATFSIVADGKTLWDSGVVSRGTAVPFTVDLSSARDLVLHVGDAGDGGYNDRADWADPLISCR